MDKNRYTGEDKEFFQRVRKQKPDLKVYYSPDLFVYHREREIFGFFLQRMCFGMDFLNLIKTDAGIKGFQPLFPMLIFLTILFILLSRIDLILKIEIFLISIIVINSVILINIKRYIKSLKDLMLTIIAIDLANIFFLPTIFV